MPGRDDLNIWIDAVCINQADDEERSSQVAIMDRIYYHASHLTVWLGEGPSECEHLAVLAIVECFQHSTGTLTPPEYHNSYRVHSTHCWIDANGQLKSLCEWHLDWSFKLHSLTSDKHLEMNIAESTASASILVADITTYLGGLDHIFNVAGFSKRNSSGANKRLAICFGELLVALMKNLSVACVHFKVSSPQYLSNSPNSTDSMSSRRKRWSSMILLASF